MDDQAQNKGGLVGELSFIYEMKYYEATKNLFTNGIIMWKDAGVWY